MLQREHTVVVVVGGGGGGGGITRLVCTHWPGITGKVDGARTGKVYGSRI